jgi:hypothetical protein
MIPRKVLRPNNQVITPVTQAQHVANSAAQRKGGTMKSIEEPSVLTHSTRGRGQQGESRSGGLDQIHSTRRV